MNQSPPLAQGWRARPGTVGGAPVRSAFPCAVPRQQRSGQMPAQSPSVAQRSWRGRRSGPRALAASGPTGPAPVQVRPLPAPRAAMGPQGNAWSGSPAPRTVAPSGAGHPGGTQMHSFSARGARFAQASGDALPMGRSGGAWIPNGAGGAAVGGTNNMGGRQPMAGGQGRAWGGGGGHRMGGSNMR
jgi:hypothetical protein